MLRYLSKTLGIAGYIIQYGCITHCTFEYIGDFVVCSGPSMEPTLYSNNILITERITPRLNRIQRGDIIIAKCPTSPTQHICKRVIGLPGDRIVTNSEPGIYKTMNIINYKISHKDKDDVATVEQDNAEKTKRLTRNSFWGSNEVVVPRGHVWIEGDNSDNSADSRYYGPIPTGLIKSRAICRLWPFNDMKSFL